MTRTERHQLGTLQAVGFLLAVPAGVALWYALVKTGRTAQYFPLPLAFTYWLALLLPRWWAQEWCTRLLDRGLARWRVRRLTVLVAGGLAGVVVFQPYALWTISWFQNTFADYIPAEQRWVIGPGAGAFFRGLYGTLPQHFAAIALWIVGNLLLDVVQRRPRFGSQHPGDREVAAEPGPAAVPAAPTVAPVPSAESGSTTPPAFSAKLKRMAPRDVIAVEAEDHYIRVFSASTSELVHYRFSDAVRELETVPGMRIHRSYWVAQRAIRSVDRTGGQPAVVLTNGVRVPIGRSYTEAARQLGILS